jgi:hypothetical protein
MSRLARIARSIALALVGVAASPGARAADVPGATLQLEVVLPPAPGRLPGAAPVRFALLERGQVFVGGTSALLSGRLEPSELKPIETRISRLRKLQGLGSQVNFGPGETRYRLLLADKRPLEIVATGAPEAAPAALQPLASLILDLSRFEHASLRPYRPEAYALSAREESLAGGCRPWTFPVELADALSAPLAVPASAAADWPTGAVAASVCAGGKRYSVTLRPLLPGERP